MSHQHASKEAAQEPTQHTTAKPFKLSPEESEIVQVWRKFDSFDSHRHHSGH